MVRELKNKNQNLLQQVPFNVDAPGCLGLGFLRLRFLFTEKSPEFSRLINIIHFHHKAMLIKKKNSYLFPKGNLPSGKVYLFLVFVVMAPIVAATFSGCNPVSFYLKGLGIEYQFQKGACQLPSDQQQK
ncbi:hypothetical protein IQ244_24375 [Nostoc sp. LEGE 06077]|uniref:hypothetical protein n=1 Tax=Nostoc sp. LEGE 06077 TaxID=915325 RepID=UPI00187E0F17|nr:hypothetical protein [Nostoc sp. LEGE 06077]MBE9209578.1 hypothetical protein [Nostoc sp. LEGE 06077]